MIHDRAYLRGRWVFDIRWTPLVVHRDSFDGRVRAIERNHQRFEPEDSAASVFAFGKSRRIFLTESGFRWQDRVGNWIDYDASGRMVRYGDRNAVEVRVAYDASGRRSAVFDHFGETVLEYFYDTAGRLARVRDRAGREVHYAYDTDGRLREATGAGGARWRYGYDSAGRLAEITEVVQLERTLG